MRIRIGLQLHTVREEMKKDPVATLKAVADIGYEGVEGNPPEGMSNAEFLAAVRGVGMELIGGNTRLPEMRKDLDGIAANCRELGIDTLMMGVLGQVNSGQTWKDVVDELAQLCVQASAKGLRICYHNHAQEFEDKVDGMYALDYIFETIPAEHLLAELDVYWVKAGGEDPVRYIQKYAGRMTRLHIKDRVADAENAECPFAEIGHGTLDWDAIFAEAPKAGVEWYVVEQDRCIRPPLESAKMSLEYLRSRGMI